MKEIESDRLGALWGNVPIREPVQRLKVAAGWDVGGSAKGPGGWSRSEGKVVGMRAGRVPHVGPSSHGKDSEFYSQ